jgi:nucleolar protein 56
MSSNTLFVLFETAYGYSLFERLETDEIGQGVDAVTAAMQDLGKFGRAIKLQAFLPFKNAAEALQNINEVSEGIMGDTLRQFLEMNLPKSKKSKDGTPKKSKFSLGVSDKTLASTIKSELGVDCVSDDTVLEVVRGLRLFAHTML